MVSTVIEVNPATVQQESYADYSALLLLPVVAALAFHYSKKQMRKAKRKMFWQFVKEEWKSKFSSKNGKKRSPLLKALLILIGVTAIFGLIFGTTTAAIAFVITLLFLAIYGSEL
ncbi:hypothetical protein [Ferruginibacter sp. SUN106]|uniref:hypothetical protein n=1 Tax=Ferruginibacter sp. SUN106 TaxID=2978348 RepID=UPI003D3699EA